MLENPLVLVRALKGCPLSVLFVLGCVRQPVTQNFISQMTGYSGKPVQEALVLLSEYGFAKQTGRYAWILNAGAQLPFLDSSDSSLKLVSLTSLSLSDTEKFRVVDNLPVSVDNSSSNCGQPVDNFDKPVDNFSRGGQKSVSDTEKMRVDPLEVEGLLREAGVYPGVIKKLMRCDWMTADYVRTQLAARERGDGLGLIVHRMMVGEGS